MRDGRKQFVIKHKKCCWNGNKKTSELEEEDGNRGLEREREKDGKKSLRRETKWKIIEKCVLRIALTIFEVLCCVILLYDRQCTHSKLKCTACALNMLMFCIF